MRYDCSKSSRFTLICRVSELLSAAWLASENCMNNSRHRLERVHSWPQWRWWKIDWNRCRHISSFLFLKWIINKVCKVQIEQMLNTDRCNTVTCFNFNWIVYGLFNLVRFTSVVSTYYSLAATVTSHHRRLRCFILFVTFALSLISILICSFLFRFDSHSTFAKRWSRFQCCVFDRRSFLLQDFVSEFFYLIYRICAIVAISMFISSQLNICPECFCLNENKTGHNQSPSHSKFISLIRITCSRVLIVARDERKKIKIKI